MKGKNPPTLPLLWLTHLLPRKTIFISTTEAKNSGASTNWGLEYNPIVNLKKALIANQEIF